MACNTLPFGMILRISPRGPSSFPLTGRRA
jgi:hypothetical protein